MSSQHLQLRGLRISVRVIPARLCLPAAPLAMVLFWCLRADLLVFHVFLLLGFYLFKLLMVSKPTEMKIFRWRNCKL